MSELARDQENTILRDEAEVETNSSQSLPEESGTTVEEISSKQVGNLSISLNFPGARQAVGTIYDILGVEGARKYLEEQRRLDIVLRTQALKRYGGHSATHWFMFHKFK